ncbi:MAG TPA: DUF177 domain-containing protein [Candidatus Bathyarchaeia archaeon]|nr:DUF177 domain-containing protein [Candidatus Bathyarchaeia archaeon]
MRRVGQPTKERSDSDSRRPRPTTLDAAGARNGEGSTSQPSFAPSAASVRPERPKRLETGVDVVVLVQVLALECVRCLRDIQVPIEVEIEEEALPTIDFHTGQAVHLAEGDDEDILRLTDHHELDLERTVREAILLAEPFAPLDREDCPGLCVVCGLPLDEGEHLHEDDDVDPRLEALRAFRPD